MKVTCLSLLSLTAGTALAGPLRRDIDTDNPSASDPTTPPSTITRPNIQLDNPYTGNSIQVPDSCDDLLRPSDQCLRDLEAGNGDVNAQSGGGLTFEKDSLCNDQQIDVIETAAYDALSLGEFASKKPSTAKEIATWKAYMGPDYSTQLNRIAGNLNRVADFKKRKKYDIIMSCKDTRNLCGRDVGRKKVGGYAWTYNGWTGYYYYITLCPLFFTNPDLDTAFEDMEKSLAKGDTEFASHARFQKNTGQLFMHEMMHLNATSKGEQYIDDETVDPTGVGGRAYGPKLVYKLAQRSLRDGGGAKRASTNADSYAWLANSLYFYDASGYFPSPAAATSPSAAEDGNEMVQLHLGSFDSHPSDELLATRLDTELSAFKEAGDDSTDGQPLVDTCESDNDCSSPNCAGGRAIYSCIEGQCVCHYPEDGDFTAAPFPDPEPEPTPEPEPEPSPEPEPEPEGPKLGEYDATLYEGIDNDPASWVCSFNSGHGYYDTCWCGRGEEHAEDITTPITGTYGCGEDSCDFCQPWEMQCTFEHCADDGSAPDGRPWNGSCDKCKRYGSVIRLPLIPGGGSS